MYGKRVWMVIGIIILIIGGWLGPAWAAELKLGCVDMQKAVNDCNAGKEAKKVIAKELEKFQRLYGERQKELQGMKESLEKQALMLNPDARAAKEKDFQAKSREFQRWMEDAQNEIKQKEMEMLRNISIGLFHVTQKVGMDEGYTFILERNENIVLFSSKALDLTDKVIKLYDAQKK
jgi:outer membrane protein